MANLDLSTLPHYANWIGKTAQQVLWAVISVGGWANVFPKKLPRWASRVRNYFNEHPKELIRWNKKSGKALSEWAQTYKNSEAPRVVVERYMEGFINNLKLKRALSDDVYLDEVGRYWFQMSPGGGVYHYEDEYAFITPTRAIEADLSGQKRSPIFKLISPDLTGGSRECVIEQLFVRDVLGEVDHYVSVSKRTVTEPEYQGSYNYSETIKMGSAAHDLRDVKPHKKTANFYLDPPLRYSTLANRYFPPLDEKKKPLAEQI